MDVIYFIGDQRFLSLVTKSSDSSPFTCNGKILNLSDCQTLAEIIATTTSLLNPITTGNGQDNEIANNSCTPKAIILFSFLNDLSKRAADPTVSSKKGLWKAIKNVNPEKLAQEAADASNQWQAMIPGLRVIWVIPPKVDFQLTNESFVVEEKQDGLSERELRGCNESTKIFCQNIVELTAIFKSDHPCIEILDLAEILPKDFNVLPWKTELDYETKLSIFQEHLKLGANDSEVGNVSGIEIDDKAALYEPFSLSSAPLGIDSDVYPMTTESLPNLASVFNDEVIESTLSNATKEISVVEGSLFEHNVIDHVETVMNNQAVGAAMFEAEKLDESVAAGAALNYATITFGKDAVNDGFTDSEGNEASDNVPDDEVKHEATSNDDSDHLEQNLEDTDKDAENLLTDSQTTQNIYSENMKDSSIKASDNDEVTATHSLDAADIPASDAKTSLPDKGADANADLEVSATQLLDAAVIQAADDGVTSVLDEGALANADVEVNYTHLLGAADIPAGNDCITSVLDKGADACAEVEMSDTCLFNAADSPASNDVITSVLDKGTDANADVEVSETCLLDAAGDPTGNDCVTSVLDEGADPNAEVEVNDTRLLDAADIPAGNDCITFVLDKGALANAEVEVSDTDLLDAAVVPACDDGVTSVIYEGALANADVEVNDTDLLGAADIPAGNDCITSVLDEGALANAEVEVSDTDLLDAAVVPACDDSVTSVLYEGADAYSDVEVSATHLLDAADIPAGDDIVTSPDKDADDMTVSTDVVVSETNKLTPVNSFESEVSIMEINVPAAKKVYQESDILTDPEEMPETDAFANEGGVGAETDAFSGSVKMGVNADTTKNLTAAEVAHVFVNNNNENKLLDAVKETYKSEKLLPEICIAVSGENAEDQNDEKCVDAYNFIALNYESDGDKDYLVSNTSAGKLSGNFEGRDEEAPFETKDLPNQEPAFSSVEVVSVGVDAENIVHACKETEKDPLTCEFDATNESNDAVIIDESKTLIDDQEDAALHSTVMTAQNEIVVLHADTNLEAFEEGRAHESNHNLEEDMQGLSENDFNITDSEPEDELKMEEPIIDAAVISSDMDGNIINVQLDASVGYGRQRKSSELGTKPSGLVDYDDAEDETPEETEADLQAELDEIPILEAEENELNLVISDVMSLHDESQLECSVNQMQTTEEINSTQVSETKNVNELSALLKANEIGNSSGVVDLTESSRDSSYKDNIEETSAIWEIGVEPEELIYEDGFASDEGDADFSKEADDQKNELPKTSYEGENSADSSFDVVCLSSKEFPSAISPTKKKGHDVAKYFSEPAQAQKIIDSESTHHCGLQYIMEVIREPKGAAATADKSESKTETSSAVTTEDCFYICTQCSKILGNTTLLMRHIKSLPHKIKFAKLHFPDAVTDFAVPNLNWEPALLAAFKKVFSEKCQELDVYSSRLAVCKEEEYQRAAYFLQRHLGDLSAFPGCVRYASTPPISECVASPPPYYPTSEPLIQDQNPEVEKVSTSIEVLVVGGSLVASWASMDSIKMTQHKNEESAARDDYAAGEDELPHAEYKFESVDTDADVAELINTAKKHIKNETKLLVISLSECSLSFQKGPRSFTFVKPQATVNTLADEMHSAMLSLIDLHPQLRVLWIPPCVMNFQDLNKSKLEHDHQTHLKGTPEEKFILKKCLNFSTRYEEMIRCLVAEMERLSIPLVYYKNGSQINCLVLQNDGFTLAPDSQKLLWKCVSDYVDGMIASKVLTSTMGELSPPETQTPTDGIAGLFGVQDAANAILAMTPKVDAAVASKSDAATTSAVDSGVSVLKDPRQKASVHLSGEEETHKRGRDEEDNDTSNNTKRSRNWLPSVTRSPRIYPPLAMDKHFSPTNSLPVKSRIGLPRRSTNDDLRYKLEKDHLNVHLPNRTSPTRQTRGIRSKTRSRSRSKSSDRYKRLNSSYRSYRNTFMWNKSRSRSASPRLRRKIYNRSRSRSPRRDRSRSPRRDRSRSPRRDRSRSPRRDRSRSLRRDRSRSPHRGRPRSPHRGRSRSPQRGRSRSPQRGRSRSSNRGRSKSPRRRSRTLSRSRSGSPRGHSLSSHKSSKGSRKHLSNTQPIGVQSKECGARRNPRNVSAVPEEENTAFDYAGSRARMLLGRTLAKTPVMGNETQPQGAATSATPHLPGHRLVASSGGTTTTKKQSFMPSTSQRLPVAHGPPPMVPLSDAHKRSRSNIPDSSQVDMISTLKNLGEMRELSEVKSCITTLLVAAVNCKMIKKDVMSTFRTPKNIVAAKRIYDKLFSCIPRSKFVPESKLVESFRSISRLITEIKTDIFCGVDAFEIASDSIELSESSIERVVNACLEGAECPEKMIPNVRKLIMDVIKLLHAQEAARLDSLSPQSTSKSKNANPEEIQQSGYNHIVSQKAREIDRAMKIKRELMPENVRIFRDDFARSTSLVRGPQQQPLDSSSDTASSSSAPSVRPMQTARTETLEYASSELLRKMEDEKLRRELQMHHDRALQERLRVMQQNMKDGGDWIVSSQRHDVSKHAPGALKATNKTAERERTKDLMDESLLLPLRFAGSKQSTSTKSSLSEMLEHEMRKYK
ncbi:uncharacterized protein LOC108679482 isoform X1 [Hyalella azteca]|uniref:Uncharacterized protein LOC108679482 isoform X1 n=1 Tax=Hyalella azteca TaxID=294128 RepID=A0A8B7PE68_HYAAZ|nr:uncharacterized protein LOC108679482 isoform X1 [Hyalella azteca]